MVYNNELVKCAHCGEYVFKDDAEEVENEETGEVTYYCGYCYRHHIA